MAEHLPSAVFKQHLRYGCQMSFSMRHAAVLEICGCEPIIRACLCGSLRACSDANNSANPPEFFHVQLPPVLALLLGAHPWELLSKPVARSERPLRQRVTIVTLHGGIDIQCCSQHGLCCSRAWQHAHDNLRVVQAIGHLSPARQQPLEHNRVAAKVSAPMQLVHKSMERQTGVMGRAVALHHWAEAFTGGLKRFDKLQSCG